MNKRTQQWLAAPAVLLGLAAAPAFAGSLNGYSQTAASVPTETPFVTDMGRSNVGGGGSSGGSATNSGFGGSRPAGGSGGSGMNSLPHYTPDPYANGVAGNYAPAGTVVYGTITTNTAPATDAGRFNVGGGGSTGGSATSTGLGGSRPAGGSGGSGVAPE